MKFVIIAKILSTIFFGPLSTIEQRVTRAATVSSHLLPEMKGTDFSLFFSRVQKPPTETTKQLGL